MKDDGFVLIAALFALLILTVLGVIAFTVSTRDIRISTRMTGEQKAFTAAETGLHNFLVQTNEGNFNAAGTISADALDSATSYSWPAPTQVSAASLPLVGYSLGGGQQWSQALYQDTITGTNTRYNSSVSINVEVGYGP